MADLFPILLWLIPLLPLVAAGCIALLSERSGKLAAGLALAAQLVACVLAVVLFFVTMGRDGLPLTADVSWMRFGEVEVRLGLLIDPLGAAMALMVAFVGAWIFVFSLGYIQVRFARFFGFLALFSGAMLLLVLANSLLLLFVAWELVGVASYLLIGFYYEKPQAAAAAQKAFITTRVGDLAFLLGMLWLHSETGTLLFYDGGAGLLESGALASLAGATAFGGLAVSGASSLLLLVGAMGKSGQVPLHVWLPDAMEGPTPVSALIHAATMVAAGVFLVARMHPLFSAGTDAGAPALAATAWVGAITALLAAGIAVGQNDIKRILAYSTVSQLGFMMVALGVGGVGAAMVHLLAHAFFKALLFLSAGSAIHGCGEEQDVLRMGGLRRAMPWTFATYAAGMLALAGFPFLFAGFWSKESILHVAAGWPGGSVPFAMLVGAAALTAFYMTRQVLLVFFGEARSEQARHAHESGRLLLVPLVVLAGGTVLLSAVLTPAWPWLEGYVAGHGATFDPGAILTAGALQWMGISVAIFAVGAVAGWLMYRRANGVDPIQRRFPRVGAALGRGLYFDAVYDATVVRGVAACGRLAGGLERLVFLPLFALGESGFRRLAHLANASDEAGINRGMDRGCDAVKRGAGEISGRQPERPQTYLRAISLGMAALALLFLWLRMR